MQSDQAANALVEEQVLNFLVNTLNEEIDTDLGEDASIDSEDLNGDDRQRERPNSNHEIGSCERAY
jgi:hypothetical protein